MSLPDDRPFDISVAAQVAFKVWQCFRSGPCAYPRRLSGLRVLYNLLDGTVLNCASGPSKRDLQRRDGAACAIRSATSSLPATGTIASLVTSGGSIYIPVPPWGGNGNGGQGSTGTSFQSTRSLTTRSTFSTAVKDGSGSHSLQSQKSSLTLSTLTFAGEQKTGTSYTASATSLLPAAGTMSKPGATSLMTTMSTARKTTVTSLSTMATTQFVKPTCMADGAPWFDPTS